MYINCKSEGHTKDNCKFVDDFNQDVQWVQLDVYCDILCQIILLRTVSIIFVILSQNGVPYAKIIAAQLKKVSVECK